jgi:hypothetical protein
MAGSFSRHFFLHAPLVMGFLLTIAPRALGDRVILTPAATTLAPAQVSAEEIYGIDSRPRNLAWLNGASHLVEFEGVRLQAPGRQDLALSAQLGLLPETSTTPAISMGVRDIFNTGRGFGEYGYFGRSVYLVAGKEFSTDSTGNFPFRNGSFTVGFGTGSGCGLFGSISADLALGLRQSLEFDGRGLNYRVSHDLGHIARLVYARVHGSNFVGIELQTPAAF